MNGWGPLHQGNVRPNERPRLLRRQPLQVGRPVVYWAGGSHAFRVSLKLVGKTHRKPLQLVVQARISYNFPHGPTQWELIFPQQPVNASLWRWFKKRFGFQMIFQMPDMITAYGGRIYGRVHWSYISFSERKNQQEHYICVCGQDSPVGFLTV